MVDVPSETPAQPVKKRFGDMVARNLYPLGKREGLRREGRRLWWEHRPDDAWVLIDIELSPRSTRQCLTMSVGAAVWPPGTWADHKSTFGYSGPPDALPPPGYDAPIHLRPQIVAPDLWPRDEPITLDDSATAEDLRQLGDRLSRWFVMATAKARALCEVDAALEFLTRPFDQVTHPCPPRLATAIVMLMSASPQHPRLAGLVESYTGQWRKDPRPITRRSQIQEWRRTVGLPPAEDLPWYWHPAMDPHWMEQYGWPRAARLLGQHGEFHFADGTSSRIPPRSWPGRTRWSWLRELLPRSRGKK